jgi:hypothetical protein
VLFIFHIISLRNNGGHQEIQKNVHGFRLESLAGNHPAQGEWSLPGVTAGQGHLGQHDQSGDLEQDHIILQPGAFFATTVGTVRFAHTSGLARSF